MPEFEFHQTGESEAERWHTRFLQSRDDRVVLTRFLAICLLAIAAINVLPAVMYWYQWDDATSDPALPRWIYLQVFAALIHVMYAMFLIQIPDWASLRAVSWAMLAVAMCFGLLSTALIIGQSEGLVVQFLGLESALIRKAAFWCVAMLCVATLASYLGGRESSRWERAEKLLFSMQQTIKD